MRRLISILLFCSPLLSSCGDPTDRPDDCSPNEYFDQARKLCFSCPASVEPSCDDGCGIIIVPDDETACPMAECMVGDDCGVCLQGEGLADGKACADDAECLGVCVNSVCEGGCVPCGPTEFVDSTLQCVQCDGAVSCPVGEPKPWVVDGACTLRCP